MLNQCSTCQQPGHHHASQTTGVRQWERVEQTGAGLQINRLHNGMCSNHPLVVTARHAFWQTLCPRRPAQRKSRVGINGVLDDIGVQCGQICSACAVGCEWHMRVASCLCQRFFVARCGGIPCHDQRRLARLGTLLLRQSFAA